MKGQKFIESARAFLAAGNGGNGAISFRRDKFLKRGEPEGGDGGNGGNVILQSDKNISSLISIYFHPHLRAANGGNGSGKKKHGKKGTNLVVKIPCGTEIWDEETHELICDLVNHDSKYLIVQGGEGGKGNCHSKIQSRNQLPKYNKGKDGENKTVRLELKIVADAGLIGFPNAGKSTLLRSISHAHPRVGAYPFTTRNPVIGTIKTETFTDLTIIDIPGLLKGAHNGAGLGDKFLRHIERAPFLVFVVDLAGIDGRHPADDYKTLLMELNEYNPQLTKRPSLVVGNKIDVPVASEYLREFVKKTGLSPIVVSALKGKGIKEFKQILCDSILKQKQEQSYHKSLHS